MIDNATILGSSFCCQDTKAISALKEGSLHLWNLNGKDLQE